MWRQFCSVPQSCLTSCDPTHCSTPGFPAFAVSGNLLKLMSTESVMPSNRLILRHPLLLLPSIFPGTRVFSSESALCIKWPKYWSFSLNISPCSAQKKKKAKGKQAARDCFSLFLLPHFLLLPAGNINVMAGSSAAPLDHEQHGDGSHPLWTAEQMDRVTINGSTYQFWTSYLQTFFYHQI